MKYETKRWFSVLTNNHVWYHCLLKKNVGKFLKKNNEHVVAAAKTWIDTEKHEFFAGPHDDNLATELNSTLLYREQYTENKEQRNGKW